MKIALTLAVLYGLARRAFAAVEVTGPSMQPALTHGRTVLVRRRARPAVGAVVVVERPDDLGATPAVWSGPPGTTTRRLIKRVAAAAGDPVPAAVRPAVGRTVVPPGAVVLLGDNAEFSYDSRQAGFFPLERVHGTVVCMPPVRRSVRRGRWLGTGPGTGSGPDTKET